MDPVSTLALIGAVAGGAGLAGRRLSRSRRDARACFLSRASEVIQVTERRPMRSGFETICGSYAGLPVAITPTIDTLSVRKLPALWVTITVQTPMRVPGTIDLMMRATGLETFSRFGELPCALAPPANFPDGASVRTDEAVPPRILRKLAPYLDLFRDGIGKEFLITPRGLRIVLLGAEADRGGYLIFRDARFGADLLKPDHIRRALDAMIAVREASLDAPALAA